MQIIIQVEKEFVSTVGGSVFLMHIVTFKRLVFFQNWGIDEDLEICKFFGFKN